MNDVAAQLLAYMNTHHLIRREATLHRAMQTAIADELRARYVDVRSNGGVPPDK